jgi:putative ABC transport system permease protein
MLKNNLKTSWRSLKRQPFFTFLNTFGLAIGMAGALLISLYIYDELSFNKMFSDSDRIYRINADIKFGGVAQEFAVTPAPMSSTVKRDYSIVEQVTRFRTQGSVLVRQTNEIRNVKEDQSTYVDSTMFDMFGIELLVGNAKTALVEPNTVVLSLEAANKHFPLESALGQSLILDNNETFRVTGVLPELPENSFISEYSIFMAMSGWENAQDMDVWGSNNFNTYAKIIPSATKEDFQSSLDLLFDKYIVPYDQAVIPGMTKESFEEAGNYIRYSPVALADLHLSGNRVAEMSQNNDKQSIYILSFVALFLIVLAVVNFMNLSTAQSLKRAKEVGVRKTLGSSKSRLIYQFLIESSLIAFIALAFALLFAIISLPSFNELSGKSLSMPFANPFFWLILLISVLALGVLSGSYPAFFLSKYSAVKVLKGGGENSLAGGKIRSSLVIFQFAISVFLIISTIVVFQQLSYIQNKDLGYQKEQILIIADVYAAGEKVNSFKEEVKKLGLVQNASLSSYLPTPSNRSDYGFQLEGAEQAEETVQLQYWRVDHEYINTLGIEIITGRAFDKSFLTDSSAIVLNESAVNLLHMTPEEIIGKRLTSFDDNAIPHTVIGVTKNFHYDTFKDEIGALSFVLGSFSTKLIVKLLPGEFTQTITSIEEKWETVAAGQPFNYYFLDDSFNDTYQSEKKLGSIFMAFTILSILVACLGLFGLAAF